MLYDPKWEAKTKADPRSIHGLIAWLEQQDPKKKYNWGTCDGSCLIHQYMSTVGIPHEDDAYFTIQGGTKQSPSNLALRAPWTFGAALDRARKITAGE